jgi:hypothetical protein
MLKKKRRYFGFASMRLERLIGEIGFPNSSNQLPF